MKGAEGPWETVWAMHLLGEGIGALFHLVPSAVGRGRCRGRSFLPFWLQARCLAVVRAPCGRALAASVRGGWWLLPHSCSWLLLGGSLGCMSWAVPAQPDFHSRLCVFGVPVCVYLPCMCLRLYLSGESVHVFVFPSAPSPQMWGKLLFLIRGQNRLVAMLAMALLIRPFGTDLSECSLRSGLPWGPTQR